MVLKATDQEAAFLQNSGDYLHAAQVSARNVLPHVFEIVKPRSVIDFGCGGGAWLSTCKDLGVVDICGVDGHYVDTSRLLFPSTHFVAHDLRHLYRSPRSFDLAISLEVAEHIPADDVRTYIESLTRLSSVILFSAAIPFQGGLGHVNEQWPSYWLELFKERGFVPIDCIRKVIWRNDNVYTWYRQNTIMFATPSAIDDNLRLKFEHESCVDFPLDLVHPNRYLAEADPLSIDPAKVPLSTAWTALNIGVRKWAYSRLHWRLKRLVHSWM